MSAGQGSITINSAGGGALPPFVNIAGARNGLSLDADDFVVLGNDIGEAGEPAQLTSNREISLLGFIIQLLRETSGTITLSQIGLVINQAFPNSVELTDLGLVVGVGSNATIGDSPTIRVLNNGDGSSIALLCIPSGFGIGEGAMLYAGQPGAVDGNYALIFYAGGGVGIGAQDFANNNGNIGGLSVDGAILGQKLPVIKTAPYNLDNRFDSGKVFTNSGATGLVVFQLPDAETLGDSGYFDFYVDSPNGIQIVAGGADVIRIGANVSAAGGSATATTQGNALRLLLLNPGESACQWVALSVIGAWVVV